MSELLNEYKLKSQDEKFTLMFERNADEHKEIKGSLEMMTLKLEQLIDKLDTKYAGKWVEKILIFLGYTCGVALLGYLGSLIYKATIHIG